MVKIYCDYCGEEIENKGENRKNLTLEVNSVSTYLDLCEKCFDEYNSDINKVKQKYGSTKRK